jgi:replicative DNA helicase
MNDDLSFGIAKPLANVPAEQALLGAILISNQGFNSVKGTLRTEHFYDAIHARTWEAFERIIGSGRLADPLTLGTELEAWAADQGLGDVRGYLADLARNAETILNIGDYAEHIVELAGRRSLAETTREAAAVANDGSIEESMAEQIAKLRQQLDAIEEGHKHRQAWMSTADVLNAALQRRTAGERVWGTGLPSLDKALGGGLFTGRVYGVEARMKQFKTGSMGTVAQALLDQDCPFLFVAMEMGAERILERLVASRTKCNAMKFRRWEEDAGDRFRTYIDAYGTTRGIWADEPGCSFARLRSLASSAVDRVGIEVMFVDYWQLVTGARKGQNMSDHLTEVAQWLAAFAPKHGVAVVIASQTNRDGLGFGSDGLAKACDWLGRLHKVKRDEHAVGGEYEAVWIEVLHNRDGADLNLGSADAPAFRIDGVGPVLREIDDWTRSYLQPSSNDERVAS